MYLFLELELNYEILLHHSGGGNSGRKAIISIKFSVEQPWGNSKWLFFSTYQMTRNVKLAEENNIADGW